MAVSFKAVSIGIQIACFFILDFFMNFLRFWPTAHVALTWTLIVLSLVVRFGIAYYIRGQIDSKNDQTRLECAATKSIFAGCKSYTFNGTVCEYDRMENDKHMQLVYTQIAMVAFTVNTYSTQYYMDYFVSNLLSSLLTSQVYRTHLYGLPAERPFTKGMSAPFNFPFFARGSPAAAQTGAKKMKEE
ncbi:hypothetical protein PAPHI01_1718 [Pancytospora philotis]|nr:hypothetical protein PAPHI01_1718 [Pancytospora philotis]